jgi:aminoglycoside phosphotransferase (APT) family kinase protein
VLRDRGDIEEAAVDQLTSEHIVSLAGGVDAMTYLVRTPRGDLVVKLDGTGLEAEAHALRAWQPFTTHIPQVLDLGTVPASGERPIKYLVLTAMKNEEGHIVETAADYLGRSPSSARDVGRALGAELQAMHQAVDGTRFGNFADSPGSERTYATWGSYLADFLGHHVGFLKALGSRDADVDAATAFMHSCPSSAQGRYVHGDVTIRNVAVHSYRPVTVGLFDPNPVIGDPSWDLAPMMNNVAFNELRQAREGVPPDALGLDRELLAGFRETYRSQVMEESLLAAQLLQAILQAEVREDHLSRGQTDMVDVEVTREFIRTLVERIAA